MNFQEVTQQVMYVVITVILPIVSAYAVSLIRSKIREVSMMEEVKRNEVISNLINEASDNVLDAVMYVNQVYTDSLKASGNFNAQSQKKAFDMAMEEAKKIIADDSKEIIESVYSSFDEWLKIKIESFVGSLKQ